MSISDLQRKNHRRIDPLLVPLPVTLFAATLGCDVVFWLTGNPMWVAITRWALGMSIVMGLAAAGAGLTGPDDTRRRLDPTIAWWHRRGNVLALLMAALSWYLRARLPVEAVIPAGIVLSAMTVLLTTTSWWTREAGVPVPVRVRRRD